MDFKVIEMESSGDIVPFYEFKCPYCNFTFFFEVCLIDSCTGFYCHHCNQRIDRSKVDR